MKDIQDFINRKKVFLAKIVSLLTLFIVFSPFVVFGAEAKIESPIATTDVKQLLVEIIQNVVIKIGSIVAVLYLIYSGYLFVDARGNPGKIDKAKEFFYGTLIGIAILLGAQAIAMIVTKTIQSVSGFK